MQTPEAEAFLKRITSLPNGPGISLDEALQPSLDDEAELRKLFAIDKANARLNDPYVGLVDVFTAPAEARTTRARVVKDDKDLSQHYVMPLSDANRRKEGAPSMVDDLEEFKKNWSIFTEGSLSQLLDWNNVVAAGGSVLACIAPLSDATKESKRSIRKYYHATAYPSSDIDLFLWGMNAEQAEKKINTIYEAVRDSIPWDVTCIRTKHTVSIHSQYPYRSIQIVLRLYGSPAEILAGFDIDAPCCLYNGQRVFANPRAMVAMMRQCNTVDMTRRSPSYEVRLTKYSRRGFEVYVPTLERENIDPTIYERSIIRIEGLARLLVLEKLADSDTRYTFLESRRVLRGRPNPLSRYFRRKRKYRGDLKADITMGGLEMNDYDVVTLHIPYGPGWDARRIDKLVYQTDLGMNSTFNPKNKDRRLHRHPAFFGTLAECLEDCCENCPEPIDSDERGLQKEEDKNYIRGRISFMEEDPGRQLMSGSFNPIDVGEWSAQVYVGEMEHFFGAIASHDEEGVSRLIKKVDVNRRDHVGRTALHVAILSKATTIACTLIDAGARMSARLVDGRSALHLAAQLSQADVIRKLLERSAINEEQSGEVEPQDTDDVEMSDAEERPSSEDDWSSEEDDVDMDDEDNANDEGDDDDDMDDGEGDDDEEGDDDSDDGGQKEEASEADSNSGEFPEDQVNTPDILDVNIPDWDLGLTPLGHAVISGSMTVIEILLAAGADVNLLNTSRDTAFHPLTLTILRDNEDEAAEILERLLLAGASSSTADDQMRTIFYRAVVEDKLKLVSTILRCDPNAQAVLDFPCFGWQEVHFPIVSALDRTRYAMLALLLSYGAKITFTEKDIRSALDASSLKKRNVIFDYSVPNAMHKVFSPVETAITNHDDVVQLLISLGADIDLGCRSSYDSMYAWKRRSIFDWVRFAITKLTEKITLKTKELEELEAALHTSETTAVTTPATWKDYLTRFKQQASLSSDPQPAEQIEKIHEEIPTIKETLNYLREIERILASRNAKSWDELYPDAPFVAAIEAQTSPQTTILEAPGSTYHQMVNYGVQPTPPHVNILYDELYEACFEGINDKVQNLCLPADGQGTTEYPLNIFVQVRHPDYFYNQTGYTPLFAAIGGRRWETAKLIMAIAAAQHQPDDKEPKFSTEGITLDDSDNESDSGDSDITIEQEQVTFVDVAKRPSTVKTNNHPTRLLDQSYLYWSSKGPDGKYTRQYTNMLNKVVYDNDFETFVNIVNLYKFSPLPTKLSREFIGLIVMMDRPDMLDEYIRKTGAGIDIKKNDTGVLAVNDKNKLYLGLSVHGKKRVDLAKMNDPNATPTVITQFLLWKACKDGAKGIVDYLSGERPLTAYRYYASSHNDELALQIRATKNLEEELPVWLGWTVSPLGESPLTSAVLSRDTDIVKKLFAKNPRLMASCLHERVKFIGYNALMLAVDVGSDLTMIDFLLAKSVSPAEADQIRGWNIYHMLCFNNECNLLEHLLQKLPRDVSEALLSQPSKDRLNTPLHLAVKNAATRATKLITSFTKATFLLRDVDGSTPLHAAIQNGFAEIASILLLGAPEALYMENGVGETPLEIATMKHVMERTRNFSGEQILSPNAIDVDDASGDPKRINIDHLDTELPRLRLILEQLFHDGRLIKKTKLAEELTKFADMMETKLAEAKAAQSAKPAVVPDKNPSDHSDRRRTLGLISKALSEAPGHRHLVHLIDVQKFVQDNLAQSTQEPTNEVEEHDGLKEEESEETMERNRSLVLQRIVIQPENAYRRTP